MKVCVLARVVRRTDRMLVTMGEMDASEAEWQLDAGSLAALEGARRTAGARAGPAAGAALPATEITVLSWAPAEHEGLLRQMLAQGAHRLVRITTPLGAAEAADPLVVADGLAQGIRAASAEVVFCGRRSSDEGRGATGPMVAALLGWPFLETDGATPLLPAVPWPAVVAVDPLAPKPGKPSFLAVSKAFKAPVENVEVRVRRPLVQYAAVIPGTERNRGREVLAGAALDEALSLLMVRLRERRVF